MNKSAKFANIVLSTIAIFFAAMFFYALSKSSLYPPGHLNIFYIISLAGFLIFIYILFGCNVEIKGKIAIFALSIVLSIYAIEIILSYDSKEVKAKKPRAMMADYLGVPFDSRSKFEVMMDYRDMGIDVYSFYNPTGEMIFKNEEISPLGFISNKTIIYCNETGEFLSYESDEHGFNNPKGLYSDNNHDYLLIGDSFIHGNCVKQEDHIAGRLRRIGKSVLNLGTGNTSPLYQLGILKEYGRPFNPKVVLWFFFEGNDHEGMEFEKKSPTLLKYLDKEFSQNLIHKQNLIDNIIINSIEKEIAYVKENKDLIEAKKNKIEEAGFNISLSTLELSRLRSRLGLAGRCKCEVDPLIKDVFIEAKRVVDDWGGQLYFIYLPAWERYPEKANYCRKRFLDTGKKDVISIINELQIPIIDIESAFSSHPDPLSLFPFRIKGHYNVKGYKLVTEQLEKHLSN